MSLIKMLLFFFTVLIISINPATASNAKKPTLILVHGALFTSSVWIAVQSYLQNHGYNVVTLDVPGRADDGISPQKATLFLAANKVCKVVEMQQMPVILVGHSQSGAVITQAINQCGSYVKGLVYVAAVVPLNGETAFQDLSNQDNENFDKCAILDAENNIFQINFNGPIKEMFMADASIIQANQVIHSMVPEPASIGSDTLHYDKQIFDAIPKFYIETQNDKIISLETQKKIESKIKFKKIYSIKASHSPFLSQPKLLGNHLIEITDSLS